MIRLECKDGAHYKFWEAELAGATLTVHFGRIGTDGQVKAKKLASTEAARAELDKLVREKLAKGYVKSSAKSAKSVKSAKSATTKARKAAPQGASRRAALLALAELLAPGHAKTQRAVALAVDAPDAYAKKYAEELEDRNAEDDPVDPWLALVIALTDEDVELARPIDWKDAAEEIAASLAGVVDRQRKLREDKAALYDTKRLFSFYDEDAHLRTETVDFIELCGRALSAHGLAVVQLDIASDSYELTVIPWKDVPRAKDLARKAGGAIVLHGPKTPLKTELAEPTPKGKGSATIDKKRFGWLVRHNDFVQMPGLLRWTGEAPGQMLDSGKIARTDTQKTSLLDCRVWPPKETIISKGRHSVVYDHAHVARIHHAVSYPLVDDEFLPRPIGTLRIERPKQPPADILERLPDGFDIKIAAWIGDLAILFPDEPTVRGKTARRPIVWNGKTLAPAKGLPDAIAKKGTRSDPWPSFLRAGFARTGAGVDVLIWEGNGFTAKGETFMKTWQLTPDLEPGEVIIGAPAPSDGFFYLHSPKGKNAPDAVLRQAEKGKCVERARLHQRVSGPPRTTPDGRVLIGLNRSGEPKKPVLAVFHPETNELTFVAPQVLGFRKDDQVEAYGVSAPPKGEAFLWVLDDEEVRRVSWRAILALPRVAAL